MREHHLDKLFEILRNEFSPICLDFHLFLSVWTHGYSFYTLDFNTTLLCCSDVPALAIWSCFSCLLGCLMYRCHDDLFFFSFMKHSLLLGNIRYYRVTLYISFPSPTLNHFSKNSGFFFFWGGVLFVFIEERYSKPRSGHQVCILVL